MTQQASGQAAAPSSMWRSRVMLVGAGAVSALAMPPLGWWWVLFLTVPLFVAAVEAVQQGRWGRAFLAGLCFGFGYFAAAFHWIGYAFFINPADIWMMPFAVGGLALFMAGYWAIAALLSLAVPGWFAPRWLVLVLLLTVAEWLRGRLLTGFPWDVIGLAVDGMGPVAQLASLVGMNGLTLLVLLWAALPVVLWQVWRREKRVALAAVAVLLTLPVSALWGAWRLSGHPVTYRGDAVVRLVQPNISQDDKWRSDNAEAIFNTLVALSGGGADRAGITHIIWPESSVPFLLDEDRVALSRLRDVLAPARTLLAGSIRRQDAGDLQDAYFTSVIMVDGSGAVTGRYDKWRLVPGGEFLPMEDVLTRLGFRKVVALPESFTSGAGPDNLELAGIGAVRPLICYEVIFPDSLVSARRPVLLVNVTNDGWFGRSTGPFQHLSQARLRSIEQGLPLFRAANTGISAVIDPMGRILERTELLSRAVVDSRVPLSLDATPYARAGDWMLLLLLTLSLFLLRKLHLKREN